MTTHPPTTIRPRPAVPIVLAALCGAVALSGPGCAQPAGDEEGVVSMFNGKDLTGWKVLKEDFYDAHGKVCVQDGNLMVGAGEAMTGIAWTGEFPADNYEVELEAMRADGEDFFCGMVFPVSGSRCALIVGGFGGTVLGLSNVDDLAADENETTKMIEFQKRRWYTIALRVADGKIEAWLDDEKVVDLATAKRRFDVWPQHESVKPFGITTWYTTGALRNIKLVRLDE